MKRQQLYVWIVLFCMLSVRLQAQESKGYGLLFNTEAYDKLPQFIEPGKGEKSITVSLRKDLSKFTPDVIHQGEAQSCVAWVTCYYAYPTQRAAQENITDRAELNRIALSAMYPYKQLRKGDCNIGVDIFDVADFMLRKGNVPFAELPAISCNVTISSTIQQRASQNFPIKGYQPLFSSKATGKQRYEAVLKAIDEQNKPVIVGMKIWKGNFDKLGPSDEYYNPTKGGTDVQQHAVTVVGFDRTRSAFKLVNSWGKQWGKQGYFWMKFDHFGEAALGAITLNLPDKNPSQAANAVEVGGVFGFQFLNNQTDKFEKTIPYHAGNGIYELNKRNWPVNQLFQLLTNNAKSAQSVCVFSIDSENKLTLHWPFFGMGVTDQMPVKNFNMVIPSDSSALQIEHAGTDYLCVLYSDKNLITDWHAIKNRIDNATGDIMSRIKAGLGDRLISPANIRYQASGMSFNAKTTQGDTVPLVLKIESIP